MSSPSPREALDAETRRKQFAFYNFRSQSAPPRKKWYRRGPLRRMGSQNSVDRCDRMVSRRLVGAIAVWHDIHSNLLQLSLGCVDDASMLSRSIENDSSDEAASPSPDSDGSDAEENASDSPLSQHNGDAADEYARYFEHDEDSGDDDFISDEILDEIVEYERRGSQHKFSLSNPDLSSDELKQLFPELSDHWRLV